MRDGRETAAHAGHYLKVNDSTTGIAWAAKAANGAVVSEFRMMATRSLFPEVQPDHPLTLGRAADPDVRQPGAAPEIIPGRVQPNIQPLASVAIDGDLRGGARDQAVHVTQPGDLRLHRIGDGGVSLARASRRLRDPTFPGPRSGCSDCPPARSPAGRHRRSTGSARTCWANRMSSPSRRGRYTSRPRKQAPQARESSCSTRGAMYCDS